MKSKFWVCFLGAMVAVPVARVSAAPTYGQVSVAGVSINGLSKAQAAQRLSRELQPRLRQGVKLTDGKTAVASSRKSLGAELNVPGMLKLADGGAKFVPLKLAYPPKPLQAALRRLGPRFKRAPVDARPVRYRGRVVIRPESAGRELNLGAAVWRVKGQLESKPGELAVQVPVRLKAAGRTRENLKGIDGVLGSFTTRFSPSQVKRTGNMEVAVEAIDGTLLPAGAVYSQNRTVGQRTQARGYRTAIIFKNGYKVPGLGGGVSQVTGTLFNAALFSGLKIVSYRTHSQPVAYLPIGRDATVAWNSFDMKFANNSGAPIYIEYRLKGSRLTATLFGKKTVQRVRLRVVSKRVGTRHIKAQLYRSIARPGQNVVKELVGRSEYRWNRSEWYD